MSKHETSKHAKADQIGADKVNAAIEKTGQAHTLKKDDHSETTAISEDNPYQAVDISEQNPNENPGVATPLSDSEGQVRNKDEVKDTNPPKNEILHLSGDDRKKPNKGIIGEVEEEMRKAEEHGENTIAAEFHQFHISLCDLRMKLMDSQSHSSEKVKKFVNRLLDFIKGK
jgi:hypothetical protein